MSFESVNNLTTPALGAASDPLNLISLAASNLPAISNVVLLINATSEPATSNLIISSSELSSTWTNVSPSLSVSELAEPPPASAPKDKLPEPSVFNTCPAEPSDVGNV